MSADVRHVLLSIEYEILRVFGRPRVTLTRLVSALDRDYFKRIPWRDLPYYFAGHDHESFIWSVIERLGLWTYKQECYGSSKTLNFHSDETCAEVGDPARPAPSPTSTFLPFNPYEFRSTPATRAIEEFAKWAAANDIRMVITFPPLADHPVYSQPAHQIFFGQIYDWATSLGISVLGRPADFRYPSALMFDTRYHLHSDGRKIHTKTLGKLMCEQVLTC